jgi:hypothetical protein
LSAGRGGSVCAFRGSLGGRGGRGGLHVAHVSSHPVSVAIIQPQTCEPQEDEEKKGGNAARGRSP